MKWGSIGNRVEGLIAAVLIATALTGCPRTERTVGTQVCLQCHDGALAPDQSIFLEGEHFAFGVECETCHGGGFFHVRAGGRAGAFIDSLVDIPFEEQHVLCADCHEEVVNRFVTSPHFIQGAASCADCHDVHATSLLRPVEKTSGEVDLEPLIDPDVTEIHLDCARCHESPADGFVQSGHFTMGVLSCTACHEMHTARLTMPQVDNSLCQQCHEFLEFPDEAAVNLHTADFHPVDPAGSGASRCSNCHMPPLEQRPGRTGPQDHTLFTIPPETTLAAAERGEFPVPPNSCAGVLGCHDPNFPGSGPPRDVNDLDLVRSLVPLYDMVGRISNEADR